MANSIIEGTAALIEENGKAIVVEDDLITSPKFLEYMNNCLELYEKKK